jgi:hypothetical protein
LAYGWGNGVPRLTILCGVSALGAFSINQLDEQNLDLQPALFVGGIRSSQMFATESHVASGSLGLCRYGFYRTSLTSAHPD